MYCERNAVSECEKCGETGLDVSETRVDGEQIPLCPSCNQQTLRGEA